MGPESRWWTKISESTVAVRAFGTPVREVGALLGRGAREAVMSKTAGPLEDSVLFRKHHSRATIGGDEKAVGAVNPYREWRDYTVKGHEDL